MDVIMRTVYEKLIALLWRLAVPLYIGERKRSDPHINCRAEKYLLRTLLLCLSMLH